MLASSAVVRTLVADDDSVASNLQSRPSAASNLHRGALILVLQWLFGTVSPDLQCASTTRPSYIDAHLRFPESCHANAKCTSRCPDRFLGCHRACSGTARTVRQPHAAHPTAGSFNVPGTPRLLHCSLFSVARGGRCWAIDINPCSLPVRRSPQHECFPRRDRRGGSSLPRAVGGGEALGCPISSRACVTFLLPGVQDCLATHRRLYGWSSRTSRRHHRVAEVTRAARSSIRNFPPLVSFASWRYLFRACCRCRLLGRADGAPQARRSRARSEAPSSRSPRTSPHQLEIFNNDLILAPHIFRQPSPPSFWALLTSTAPSCAQMLPNSRKGLLTVGLLSELSARGRQQRHNHPDVRSDRSPDGQGLGLKLNLVR